jgi:hypothetical protein
MPTHGNLFGHEEPPRRRSREEVSRRTTNPHAQTFASVVVADEVARFLLENGEVSFPDIGTECHLVLQRCPAFASEV